LVPGSAAPAAPASTWSAAEREWQQYGKDTKDLRLLEAFKEKHKADPVYARLAEARIEELVTQIAAASTPSMPERPAASFRSLAVISVSGAPGDGATSLTAAIQRELASRGVGVTDNAIGAYRVQGVIALGQAWNGRQAIHIEWTVTDPYGTKLGNVAQNNEIPEGALNGAWGKSAEQAAGAAAQGIARLMPR
jgi:hypothetical protein